MEVTTSEPLGNGPKVSKYSNYYFSIEIDKLCFIYFDFVAANGISAATGKQRTEQKDDGFSAGEICRCNLFENN